MPRISRRRIKNLYFHIMTQGIEKKYIFEKTIYKNKYRELLYKYTKEYNIKLIAYCIMNNHVHILIKTANTENMSKAMHKINFKYAQYYNFMEDGRVGYVFRNRFNSQPILNEKHLYNCIKYIHNNPIKAKIVSQPYQYKYSSYNEWKENNKNINEINKLEEDYIFIDIDMDEKEISKEIIERHIEKLNISLKDLNRKENKEILKKLIIELKRNYKISYKMISEESNISLSKISRLINKK